MNIFNFTLAENLHIDLGSLFRKKYTKDNVTILFIDDNDMPIVQSLKKAGYKVKKVNDIKNIDVPEIITSQIIFIDYEGVGKFLSPHHQGAGIVKEIKEKYKSQKYVILYTAQATMPSDTTMNTLFVKADARMRKDSDTTDFMDAIREGLKHLK